MASKPYDKCDSAEVGILAVHQQLGSAGLRAVSVEQPCKEFNYR